MPHVEAWCIANEGVFTDALIVKTYVISAPTKRFVLLVGDVLTMTDESKIR